ncbi:methionyl-tRNA formyltransferase [archaeon]|nr:MAG: methionyl-tRNA formyltransferase [archaeon]
MMLERVSLLRVLLTCLLFSCVICFDRMFRLRLSTKTLSKHGQTRHIYLYPPMGEGKRKLVFLGTPSIAAKVLDILHSASLTDQHRYFDIAAVVTQPPALAGRNKKLTKSPVQNLAEKKGLKLFIPDTAKDPEFLQQLEEMQVDLFITAAYGNYLPHRFLRASRFGTINIHPSLLPKYRGAAPVQRCLEQGDKETGVSLLYSVAKMDAGPILAQVPYPLTGNEKAPQVLDDCFHIGANALLSILPTIFHCSAVSTEQDEKYATLAPKLTALEGNINFYQLSAQQIHNKCRGFADWPGIYSFFNVSYSNEIIRIKILTTILPTTQQLGQLDPSTSVGTVHALPRDGLLVVKCAEDSYLGILELQPANKKPMSAKAFINGFKGSFDMKFSMQINSKQQ